MNIKQHKNTNKPTLSAECMLSRVAALTNVQPINLGCHACIAHTWSHTIMCLCRVHYGRPDWPARLTACTMFPKPIVFTFGAFTCTDDAKPSSIRRCIGTATPRGIKHSKRRTRKKQLPWQNVTFPYTLQKKKTNQKNKTVCTPIVTGTARYKQAIKKHKVLPFLHTKVTANPSFP